ncbi:MAG: hypothetical protein CMN77_16950 [Spirochaetaceae bacterium]|nr:hypothetical protein [Spirochaetaceae bacterium]|tara:strand:+ start:513 stop:1700 length:1188 start_codon:yes stop_codon:yes gene_type:complete
MNKPRLTVILGAGAVAPINGASTKMINQRIQRRHPLYNRPPNFVHRLWTVLERYYQGEQNFEDVFHAIERLLTFDRLKIAKIVKEYKTIDGAFIRSYRNQFLEFSKLKRAHEHVIRKIASAVRAYSSRRNMLRFPWYMDFWLSLESTFQLNIFSLNYDTLPQSSLQNYVDGYSYGDPAPFQPAILKNAPSHTICNLHGHIYLGYPGAALYNQNMFDRNSDDLWKYGDSKSAEQTWYNFSAGASQSASVILRAPLITGLNKPDKTVHSPFADYVKWLYDCLVDSPRLLIIGYSFGDLYINSLLQKYIMTHSNGRKVVIADYLPPDFPWHPDPAVMDWPSNNFLDFAFRAFKAQQIFNGHATPPRTQTSSDQQAAIHLKGFGDLATTDTHWLKSFLT